MIYLVFDSNIWIYLLDESWKEDNPLDYLDHWISENHIRLLLPSIVIKEWENNKIKEKEKRKKDLRDFFAMANEILDSSSFLGDKKDPEKQSQIIEKQFNRIENLLKNNTKVLEVSANVINLTIERSISKQAPMHKNKNSVADTLIILSFLEFVHENPDNHFLFISENIDDFFEMDNRKKSNPNSMLELCLSYQKDLIEKNEFLSDLINYFEKNYKIHTDIKEDFDKIKVANSDKYEFVTFNKLKAAIGHLKTKLPVTVDLQKIRDERKRTETKEITYNPEYDKLVKDLPANNYIENVNHLDIILKKYLPTQEEAKFTIALLSADASYKDYFFKNVQSPQWFNILKEKGVFNPIENPSPIQVNDGFQIPLWEPLLYLEKISNNIKNGDFLELIDEILSIIIAVSENPKDNYRTWYFFIKILSNIPNHKITLEILNYIPIWLSGQFDTMIQSAEICDSILPKFLNDNPTQDDILKVEVIIKHLFTLEKGEFLKKGMSDNYNTYGSRVYMHYLKSAFTINSNIEKITEYCSSKIVFQLIDNLKKLRFDFPKGIDTKIQSELTEYLLKTEIADCDLKVTVIKDNQVILSSNILNFEQFDKVDTLELIKKILRENKINFLDNTDNNFNFKILVNALFNGSYYNPFERKISNFNDDYHSGENPTEVFSLILRDILNQLIKTKIDTAKIILNEISFNSSYRLPFFKRIAIFLIGENWKLLRSLFLDLIMNNDPQKLFTESEYQEDLYELLNKNQEDLNDTELNAINEIINIGPQLNKIPDESYPDYWRLRWYTALRLLPQFTELYSLFSKRFGKTFEDFNYEKEVFLTAGDSSPLNTNELFKMSNENIVKYIHSFKPKDRWDEPSISGLANILGKAIENEPLRFSEEIDFYSDVYFIYVYQIACGFTNAWKNKQVFNWEKVLQFLFSYINDERFKSEKFALENDSWQATSEWVVGAVANLLSEGMRFDSNAYEKELLPLTKSILSILLKDIEPVDDIKLNNRDYVTYTLNSTAGKVLISCLDFSLRNGRINYAKELKVKWDNDTKEFFESALKKKIIDAFVLMGWHYQQFYFLDSDWLNKKVIEFYDIEEKYWLAFISGFAFSSPPFNKSIYLLFYNHYERAISFNVIAHTSFPPGLTKHFVAFYFWGFEDLKSKGLLSKIIESNDHGAILDLLKILWSERRYIDTLTDKEDIIRFEKAIFELWTQLAEKYENGHLEDETKVLMELYKLLDLVPELTENYTNLVLKSTKVFDKGFHSHFLIESLLNKKDKGDSNKIAEYIGIILNKVNFASYFSSRDNQHFIDLVTFLYQNGQKKYANEFCNKMVKEGHEFLRNIYNFYQ